VVLYRLIRYSFWLSFVFSGLSRLSPINPGDVSGQVPDALLGDKWYSRTTARHIKGRQGTGQGIHYATVLVFS